MKDFQFKKFSIRQQKSAMKVGTDGVLLGAWTPVSEPSYILDIGAGTGLLSLMLAQRTEQSIIHAVEVDTEAFEECFHNFYNSIWKERLQVYLSDIQCFTSKVSFKYDVIISNPPYFTENIFSEQQKRNLARFTQSLPFEDLLFCVSQLLTQQGYFSVVIPYQREKIFIELAHKYQLFPTKITHVKGNIQASIKRSLLLFSRVKTENVSVSEIIIEKQRHVYTDAYIDLTQDFYLNLKK